jgi:hypothetical protein
MPVPSTQPDPTLEVIAGRNTFRINQEVDSGGAIFEIDTSILNAFVGPNSDFSNYAITYYDQQRASGLNQTIVSSDTQFAGRIDALLRTQIPSTGQPARILVQTLNNYAPGGPDLQLLDPTEVTVVRPTFDFISAIGPIDNPPTKRGDRTFFFPDQPTGGGVGTTRQFIAVPIYGRNKITITAEYPNVDLAGAEGLVHASVFDFFPGGAAGLLNYVQTATLNVWSPEPKTISFTADRVGFHDYLVLELARYTLAPGTGAPTPSPSALPTLVLTVTVSDRG